MFTIIPAYKCGIVNLGVYTGNLILPIPFREMEVNDLLEQNSWYSAGR